MKFSMRVPDRRLAAITAGLAMAACGAGKGNGSVGVGGSGSVPVLTQSTQRALQNLSPVALPAPPPDSSNRYADDPAAATLGKQFFFDPGFSGPLLDEDNRGGSQSLGNLGETGKVACAGCHIPSAGFQDNRSARKTVSLAAGWGKRKARSLLDVGHAKILMWDGRRDALYNQPFGALESGVEMNSSRLYAAQQIYKRYRASYEAVFGAITVPLDDATRFPQLDATMAGCRKLSTDVNGISKGIECHGVPGDGAEFDGLSAEDQDAVTRIWVNVGKAIAAYERLLSCGPSRFDDWVQGQSDALSPAAQRGAALFVGQRADGTSTSGCNTCHGGPFLTDQSFHNVGLRPIGVGPASSFIDKDDRGAFDGLTEMLADPLNVKGKFSDGDDGRLPSTVAAATDGAFRTPSLRCVALRPSFMHTGQMRTLLDTVEFFSRGGDSSDYPGTSELKPLNLTAQEVEDLVAFLQSLTGPGPDPSLLEPPELPP